MDRSERDVPREGDRRRAGSMERSDMDVAAGHAWRGLPPGGINQTEFAGFS